METAALETEIKQLKEMLNRNADDKREIYKRLSNLEMNSARVDEKYIRIMAELDSQKKQLADIAEMLDTLSKKPAKRWDAMISSIISAVVAGAVGFLVAHFS